jgi:hypothetical protein
MRGRLWRTVVDRAEADRLRAAVDVLATRRTSGQIELKVHSETPPEGFEPAEPDLEDVYFAALIDAGIRVDVD